MTMLSEAVRSVGPACRTSPALSTVSQINNNLRSSTNHTLSLLPRSSGEKLAVRPDERVVGDCKPQSNSIRFSSTLKIISILTVLLGLLLGFGSRANDPVTTSVIAEAAAAPATPKYKTVAIGDIQPAGYRVLADNPQTPGQAAGDFGEFDPKTWQVHRFLVDRPDGGWQRISLARPLAWIESVERNDMGQVWMEFEELGIGGWATLQATEPCPTDIVGEGRVVTGTFEHPGEYLNLFIAGEATPIGSTAGHFFWSEDRQNFFQISTFRYGERLRLADGSITHLDRTEPAVEQQSVYTLEVDGEHVFYVGESGALVHNASSAPSGTTRVTSWAGGGAAPDLKPGRWVVKGEATIWNFFKTGLWGPKTSKRFPYIKSPNRPFRAITDDVPNNQLIPPKTSIQEPFALIKKLFGQYQLGE